MFVRLSESGEVSYSQRLTVRAPCQLTVALYPLDLQTCHLNITSFGHLRQQVNYSWAETPVTMANIRWETERYHQTVLEEINKISSRLQKLHGDG